MKCVEFRERMLEYVDGELGDPAARTAEQHLAQCRACREQVAEHRRVWQLLGELEGDLDVDSVDLAAMADRIVDAERPVLRPHWSRTRWVAAAAAAVLFIAAAVWALRPPTAEVTDAAPIAQSPALLNDPEFVRDFEVIRDLNSLTELEEEGLAELLDLDDEDLFLLNVMGEA